MFMAKRKLWKARRTIKGKRKITFLLLLFSFALLLENFFTRLINYNNSLKLVAQRSDQLERIFAYFTLFILGSFYENYKSSKVFFPTFSRGHTHTYVFLFKKPVGTHFGRFFSQTHLVTLRVHKPTIFLRNIGIKL
jgi:hypothetical protein